MKPAPNELDRFELLEAMPDPNGQDTSIKEVSGGDYLKLDGDVHYVYDKNSYKEPSGFTWYELTLLNLETGNVRYFEWEQDGQLYLYLTIESLRPDDLGQSSSVDDIVTKAESDDSIQYNGKTFYYDMYYEATYQRDDEKYDVAFMEFTSGDHSVTLEEWEQEHELWLSKEIDSDSVEVVAVGE